MLPKRVVSELRKRAEEEGKTLVEFLVDITVKDPDKNVIASKYLEVAVELLEQAREELVKGDLRQANEKIWGAVTLAIKAHALAREGRRLRTHADLWVYKNRVAEELGDWVRHCFRDANAMHQNFYEGTATKEDVEDALECAEKLVKAIREKLGM